VAYKESPPAGWKEAQPADGQIKGKWWEIYQDPILNTLVEQVNISNQNVLVAEAQYLEAKASVRIARSALFPQVGATASVQASRAGGGRINVSGTSGGETIASSGSSVQTIYSLPITATYQVDLFGAIRRQVTAAVDTAQATAAQLDNVRLLFQTELAQDYFQLRSVDTQQDLLTRAVASYKQFVELTRNRFNAGVASDLDVAQAETLLYNTEAELTELGVQRAALEHAIAVLTGHPPAQLTLPAALIASAVPPVPAGIPSALLERRPDIATAERNIAVANEQIGIAKAAYYPSLTLNGTAGFEASRFVQWFSLSSRFWTVGAALAETLYDGGRRKGQVRLAEATYDQFAAAYRQTVLTAFQQVEDNLAALRLLQEEAAQVELAIVAAQRQENVAVAQYKAGTGSYLQVTTAQVATLQARQTGVILQGRRLVANVLLIEALGGGWSTSQLPSRSDVLKGK
jgi:NodT family efflux transporter outer membrane factor (OMF) lipoprotein